MNCSICSRKAVFHRKYEGRSYCPNHFIKSIESKAKRTIRKHGMLNKGEKIAVALSGGKDSCVVLYIMHSIMKHWPEGELIAISIDEGIKGYRKQTLDDAKMFCKWLGVKHYTFSFRDEFDKTLDQIVKEKNEEPCTYCGIARRYLLNKKARELKVDKLCMGHNLDDEIQGILLNYLKGNLSRASRMDDMLKPKTKTGGKMFVPRIKPLRHIPEREIALYAILRNKKNKKFPINIEKECPYSNGLRFDARDFLNLMETKYPGIKFSFLETFDKIKPCIESIVATGGDVNKCKICGEPATGELCKTCDLWRFDQTIH